MGPNHVVFQSNLANWVQTRKLPFPNLDLPALYFTSHIIKKTDILVVTCHHIIKIRIFLDHLGGPHEVVVQSDLAKWALTLTLEEAPVRKQRASTT